MGFGGFLQGVAPPTSLIFAVKMRNLHAAASGPERGNLRLAQDVTRGK